jgi:hypothetical protein
VAKGFSLRNIAGRLLASPQHQRARSFLSQVPIRRKSRVTQPPCAIAIIPAPTRQVA